MNKLGEKGLYTAESKKKRRQDQISRTREIEELKAHIEALTAERERALENGNSTKKVDVKIQATKDELESAEKNQKAVIKKNSQEECGTQKTAKRKRSSNATKEEEVGDDAYNAKPANKSRANKVKKEDGAEAVKEVEEDFPAVVSAPKKRAVRGKKAVKEEGFDYQYNKDGSSEVNPKMATNKAESRKVKKESLDEQKGIGETVEHSDGKSNGRSKDGSIKAVKHAKSSTLKRDPSGPINTSSGAIPATATESYIPSIKDSDLQYDFDMALEAGEIDDDFEAYIEMRKAETAQSKQRKSRKGKKT